MSTLCSLQFLRVFPRLHPVCVNIVRHRRWTKRRSVVANTLDPDKDFYLHEEMEEEPVAYLQDGANLAEAAQRPRKLTPSMEREMKKAMVKKEILKKKEWKENVEKEPTLLTWAARAQIRHLNKMDPDQWDPETLARSFPVSVYTIREILRSKLVLWDLRAIQKYDRGVYKNWMKLKYQVEALQQGQPVDPRYRLILEDESRRSLLLNAAGITDLPVPQEQAMLQTQVDIAQQARPRVRPTFSSILDNCRTDPPGQESVGETTDKHYIGLSDPEMVGLLEDISSCKKKDDVLSIEGDNLGEEGATIETENPLLADEVEDYEEPMFQRHSKPGHRQWTDNREENSNKTLSVKNQQHFNKHESFSKQERSFTNRDRSNQMDFKTQRSGRKQAPHVFRNQQNISKHRDSLEQQAHSSERGDKRESPHYVHQDNRNETYRNYGNRNKAYRNYNDYDDYEDSSDLTGSLEDINLLHDKPSKKIKPKKTAMKKTSY